MSCDGNACQSRRPQILFDADQYGRIGELTLRVGNGTNQMIEVLSGTYDLSSEPGGTVGHYLFEMIEPGKWCGKELHGRVDGPSGYIRILSIEICKIGGKYISDFGTIAAPLKHVYTATDTSGRYDVRVVIREGL